MKTHTIENTSVLVVGGGLAGLSAALFLAWQGVPCVLVEKHANSSPHPRAIGFTTRTLELLRAVGLGPDIPQVPIGSGRPRRIVVESLAGKWAKETDWTPSARKDPAEDTQTSEYSPVTGAAIAQDRMEPILRQKAITLGADVRMNTQLLSFAQDANGVTAILKQRDSGEEYTLHAKYLVAADGHTSPIRESLGITRSGHGFMHIVRSVLFRAELEQYLESGISQFQFDQPDLKGMLTTYRDGRWVLMFNDDEERDEGTLRSTVVRAIGRDDVDIDIITTGRWVLSALIAQRFSQGRIFLIGDAAHTLPPARGGYGANTGIEDAHNLAWKLAAVLLQRSDAKLLDSYDAERRPIAWLRHDQIFARQDYAAMATTAEKRVALIEDDAMELGQRYDVSATAGTGAELPRALRPDQWRGQPGTRAPHLWVSCAGEQRSLLDALQRDWVLLTEDDRWLKVTTFLGAELSLNLTCCVVSGSTSTSAHVLSPPLTSAAKLTLETPIEQMVAHARGKAVLDAHVPELTTHDSYSRFKGMSLTALQPLSRGIISDANLRDIAAALTRIELEPARMDANTFLSSFRNTFGLTPSGAVLVRPDGYIAWRAHSAPRDILTTLATALNDSAYTKRTHVPAA